MTTKEIATRLVELSREGNYEQLYGELYAPHAKSIEPENEFGMETVEGLANFKAKADAFNNMVEEFHGSYISDPVVAGDYFTVAMGMDMTVKGAGRTNFEEIALYRVENGKVVSEQFFY